eukprot:Em0003g1599a
MSGANPQQLGEAIPPKEGSELHGGVYLPQGGAYPSEGGAYPPQGGAYLPQGYPPQGYPPQGGEYPPQGGAYAPQGGAYPEYPPPQGGVQPVFNGPPPPYYPQAIPQQQTGCNVVIVQPKSTAPVYTPVGDYGYTLSIVLTIICFLCGTWWSLCCTIPAIFVACSVSSTTPQVSGNGSTLYNGLGLGQNRDVAFREWVG